MMVVALRAPQLARASTRAVTKRNHVGAFIQKTQAHSKSLTVKVIEINLYRITYR